MITKDEKEAGEELARLCSTPPSGAEWAVAQFLEAAKKSWLKNPGEPYCAKCWIKLKLNENGDIWCPECGLVIQVEGENYD